MTTKTTFEQVWEIVPNGFGDMENEAQAFWNNDGYWENEEPEEFWDKFTDALAGNWDSETDFAEEFLESTGELEEIPEHLRYYFDYAAFARDLFISDYWSARMPSGGIVAFRNW